MPEAVPELSVLMVSASIHPHVGGAEKQALLEAVTLRERGAAMATIMELTAYGAGSHGMHH